MNRTPVRSEAEFRHDDRQQNAQHYAYDLTAKLTYFVVSAQLIFCGYVLLNAEQYSSIKYSSLLFLTSGLAAFFGVFWRFSYNQRYHDQADEKKPSKKLLIFGKIVYCLYVFLTIIFFSSLLFVGYKHLAQLELKASEIKAVQKVEFSVTNDKLEKSIGLD